MKTKLFILGLILFNLSLRAIGQFEVNNDAVDLGSSTFRLTQAVNNQAGSVWYKLQHDLNDPLNVQGRLYFGTDDAGADGISFVLQNNCLSAGSIGGGIGYGGMPGNSIAVEFDTYENISGSGDYDNSDPVFDHMAIQRSGNVDHATANNLFGPIQTHASKANIEDGIWYDFRINYDPATTTLSVYFDNTLRISFTYDIVTNIFGGDPYVYWGFTSSTGGFNNEHQVFIDRTTTTFGIQDRTICSGSVSASLPPLSRYYGENLSLGKTAVSSSDEAPGTGASNVIDGNIFSRWSSQFSDPQWIYVDLGAATDVDSVILNWEGAYGTDYFIQTSTDASSWNTVYHETSGNGGIDKIYFTATNIRYVRMYGNARATSYGYSLWEFEVYGKPKYIWSPDNGTIDDIYSENPTFTPGVTTTYTVLIPDPCNGPTPYNFTVTVDCSMPVEFATFTAIPDQNSTYLNWTTSSEINSSYFEILRSVNGVDFETIGIVSAAGNSQNNLSYSFIDYSPNAGINYYRIKEVDKDGMITYSEIRQVQFEKNATRVQIGKNHIILTGNYQEGENISVQIITLNGQLLYKEYFTGEGNTQEISISISNLSSSMYILNINSNEESVSQKFLVQ